MLPFKDDNPTRTFAIVVVALIAVNAAVFLYQAGLPYPEQKRFVYSYAAIPAVIVGLRHLPFETGFPAVGTLFTSMFLHGGVLHIGGNMLFLWVFGNNIEDLLGHVRFIAFYVVCGVAAMAAQVMIHPGSVVPALGASGAIAGVLGAYALRFPGTRVHTLILPLPIVLRLPALFVLGYWFLLQWLGGQQALGAGPQMSGTAWFAHIGGFIAGMALIGVFQMGRRPPRRRPRLDYGDDYPGRLGW